MYGIQDSYSENWRIKLSDFGNSILGDNDEATAAESPVHGTPLYQAPELDRCGAEPTPIEIPRAIDIWSWGMLLWEVINDGTAYEDRNEVQILPDMMQQLRRNGELDSLAYDTCLSTIKKKHAEEHGDIRRIVLEALQEALQADPHQRPSVSGLLSRLQRSLPDEK